MQNTEEYSRYTQAHEEVNCLSPSSPFMACEIIIKTERLELSSAVLSVRGAHQQGMHIG